MSRLKSLQGSEFKGVTKGETRKKKRKKEDPEDESKYSRKRGIVYEEKSDDGTSLQVFIPWKKGLRGKYVDVEKKVILMCDYDYSKYICGLCGEGFAFEKDMEEHYDECLGIEYEKGRDRIDKFVERERAKSMLQGSRWIRSSGEFARE